MREKPPVTFCVPSAHVEEQEGRQEAESCDNWLLPERKALIGSIVPQSLRTELCFPILCSGIVLVHDFLEKDLGLCQPCLRGLCS